VPFEGKKLVAIGFINAENGVEVYVTSTVATLNGKQDSLKQVVVHLFENDILIDTLKLDGTIYKTALNFKAKTDKTYRIEVKALDFGPLSTDALKLPFATKIEKTAVNFKDSTKERFELSTFFEDTIGKNYYALQIERYANDTLMDIKNNYSYRFLNPTEVFSDEKFDNKLAEIIRNLDIYSGRLKANRLKIRLYSINEATYLFYRTIDTQSDGKSEYFIEPTKVYSNIKNGYGIWGAYSVFAIELRL
jgi:Domain of unknown function (DUF4249)